MKFASSSFLFTALLVLSTGVIPSVAQDPAAPTFPPTTLNAGDYEIEVVVNDEDDTATDLIAGVDPFTVTSFFEVSNKYTDSDGEWEENNINNIVNAVTVEVYTTVILDGGDSEDDCSKGTLIESECETDGCFTIYAGAVNRITDITYPSPRNEDYIVGATRVRLSNFMSNVIYVANVAEDLAETGGTVEFCVRTSIKLGDETVSHIDSKKQIQVDLAGNFASLTVNNIVKADNKDFEATVVKEIQIDTFVCNIRNEPVDSERSYKIGEQFRICVGPIEEEREEGYEVDNFVEVICGTGTAARTLVDVDGPTDILTTIEELPLKNYRRAMKSVITTGYAVDGITTLSCTGKVSLSYTAPAAEGGGGGNGGIDSDGGVATNGGGESDSDTNTGLAPTDAVSAACFELCNTPGNRGVPIPADTIMEYYNEGGINGIVNSYIDGTPGDNGAKAMYGNLINCWDISLLSTLDSTFSRKTSFNEPLNCWNTAHITSMYRTFTVARSFNQDISMWDISSVTSLDRTFVWSTDFNQDISSWDTSNVNNMAFIFESATVFDEDLNEWDTSRVTNMQGMFVNAWDFNQDISGWDTSRASNMQSMFNGAYVFNQDISGWDTSRATNMQSMFVEARNFDQNLCNWEISSNSNNMLVNSGCGFQSNDSSNTVCQSCGRRLGSSSNNNNNNSINRNSNNKHRNDRNLQGIVADNDDTSVTTGTSTLQALRNLQPSTEVADPSGAGGGPEELLEGLFELNIGMDIPSNESSASLPSSMTTATVAVIAVGSILSVVSSMIY